MSDVNIVKSLVKNKRGRPATVVSSEDESKLLDALNNNPLYKGELTKKQLVDSTGLPVSVVEKFVKTHPLVKKVGSKKGTKYTTL